MVITEDYSGELEDYVPYPAIARISRWLRQYNVRLRLASGRTSKYGDYYWCSRKGHCISVNRDLNPYSFLLTLVHEVAHLRVQAQYGNRVRPHGQQWKREFRELMLPFLNDQVFPDSLLSRVASYLKNPKASTCTDERLIRGLRQYDSSNGTVLLENIEKEAHFKTQTGRVFRKGKQLRKRFRCQEMSTEQIYLFNPVTEVYKL